MNAKTRCLQASVLVATLAALGVAQTANSQQKSAGRASTSSANKPLSFFVGSWVYSESAEAGHHRNEYIYRMLIQPSEKKGELSATLDKQLINRCLGCTSRTRDHVVYRDFIKATIEKIGNDYKLHEKEETSCDYRTTTPKGDETQFDCGLPDLHIYTLKILSQDEIVVVYKPNGVEWKYRRE